MINSLYGTLQVMESNRIWLLSEGGIEWDIAVSSRTIHYLTKDQGDQKLVRLYTHLYHKDDVHLLFGFATIQERLLFRSLLRVNGIGPRNALQILSHLEVEQIVAEIEQGSYQLLHSVPGIGEKSAQRIVLSLKGSVNLSSSPAADIEQALVEMGYSRSTVQRTLAQILKTSSSKKYSSQSDYESAILQLALQELGK